MFPQTWLHKLLFRPTHLSKTEAHDIAQQGRLTPWLHNDKQIGWKRLSNTDQKSTPPRVLVLHGNGGEAVHRSYLADHLEFITAPSPADFYILEYPGYSSREGEASQNALVEAAAKAIDILAAQSAAPIVVWGQSLGTGVACQLAATRPDAITGILLITPFASIVDVAKYHYPWAPIKLFWKNRPDRFDSSLALKNYHGPISFLLAGNDKVVPMKFGEQLYEDYDGPKLLFVAPDGGHNDLTSTLPINDWKKAWKFSSQPSD
ncbi:MAG: alpha/beta hydrolase [Chthoniobacterales bacterium]